MYKYGIGYLLVYLIFFMSNILYAEELKIYRHGEIPDVGELRNILLGDDLHETMKPVSRLGKSKGFKPLDQKPQLAIARKISLPIEFENNSYRIGDDPDTQKILNNLSSALSGTNIKLIIEGHTNAVGSPDYNYELSVKRADAVKDYLINQGVKQQNLVTLGMGFKNPIPNTNPVDGVNRRVQFKVVR